MYDLAGGYALQVSVTDGFATALGTGSASISAATMTLSGGVMEGGVAGTTVSRTWASFTDTNPNDATGSYSATINWGDGSSGSGTVTGSDGDYIVSGSHTYTTDGAYTVTVGVANHDGTSESVTSTAQVGDVYAGVSATLTVATFTVSDTSLTTGDVTATINWGDGTSSIGTITGSGGVFTVEGTHLYTSYSLDQPNGVDTISVTLSGPNEVTLDSSGDESITATKLVTVEPPQLIAFADDVLATPSVAFTNTDVATFADPDVSDSSAEFSATIYWGDGTSSIGTITGSSGLFQVLGSHSYTTSGTFAVETSISQTLVSTFGDVVVIGAAQVATNVANDAQIANAVAFGKALQTFITTYGAGYDSHVTQLAVNGLVDDPKIIGINAAVLAVLMADFNRVQEASNVNPFALNPPVNTSTVKSLNDLLKLMAHNQTLTAKQAKQAQARLSLGREFASDQQRIAVSQNVPPFVGNPNINAVQQGATGDCAFLAALISLTKNYPSVVKGMIKNPDQVATTYTVTFPRQKPIPVAAPTQTEIALYGGAGANGLWVTIIEKAYATLRKNSAIFFLQKQVAQEQLQTGELIQDSIATLTKSSVTVYTQQQQRGARGVLNKLFTAGKNVKFGTTETDLELYLNRAFKVGAVITLGVAKDERPNGPSGPILPGGHAYTIVAITDTDQGTMFTIRNPWGLPSNPKYGQYGNTFTVPFAFLYEYFGVFAIQNIPGKTPPR